MCCKKNSFLITEGERAYIRNLYGLLTEATGEGQITITADSTFGSGKYSQLSQEGIEELQGGLERASTWMTENKGSLIFVQIVAVESQLTNYDTEQDPKVPVAEKVLSRLRAKTLKRYLVQYFQSLVASGVLTEMPIFQEPRIEIGPTKYVKGQTVLTPALLKKYETEQKVSVELKLMAPEKCLVDLEVEVKYEKERNAAFPCRGGHTCNDANFEVKMNGVPIGRANLNNANDSGSRTSGIIKIDDAMAKDIIGVNSKEILFSLKCLSGQNCHSGTPEVIIKKKSETIYHSCSPAMSRGDQNEYPIHTLDVCGNVLKKGTGDATNKDTAAQETTVKGYTLSLPDAKALYGLSWIYDLIQDKRLTMTSPNTWQEFVKAKFNGVIKVNGGLVYIDKYDDKKVMDVDPGTIITKIVEFGKPNDNPIPNMKMEGLTWGDETSSGKYHVESVKRGDKTYLSLVSGPSPRTLSDEKSKNIVRFNLDDEAIEEFEKYYIPSKVVEKTPDGMYKVIANKMTYASNVYNKGTILKLDS
jgi:hypothetical protein